MVRTIDREGKQVGIIPLDQALALARSCKLDLVEVAPSTDPPVCRVMDFGKYQYQQMKKDRLARRKQFGGKLKEIKFRPRIEVHDYNVKLRHAREFLAKGYKLRIRLFYRGREMAHFELGDSLLRRLEADLGDIGHVEMPQKKFGRNVVMMFAPHKGGHKKAPAEAGKDDRDAKTQDKSLRVEAVQDNSERQGQEEAGLPEPSAHEKEPQAEAKA